MILRNTFFALTTMFALNAVVSAQTFQSTIKAGTQANSVKSTIKPNGNLDGQISSVQVSFMVSTSVGARPTASILNNPVTGLNYAQYESTETLADGTYYVWQFDGIGGATVPVVNYTSGVEYDLLEIKFDNGTITPSQVRLAQLPNGGTGGTSPGNYNFYLAMSGNDVTNQVSQFYGGLSSNDGNGYSGYSWAAVNGIALPVKFTGFNVAKVSNNALLNWSIENESALTDHYEIERSLNSTNFSKINTTVARNNGASTNNYNYTDVNLSAIRSQGYIYYRVKQVDKDGKFVYTDIKSVKIAGAGFSASVYPNPVVSSSEVNINLTSDVKISILLIDAAGKTIQTSAINGLKGLNTYPLNMTNVAKGTYMVKVIAGTDIQTIPVIKK
ncbi:MAG: T9SS type A sorting domain-containing protein [Ferruginibacter sp.]